MRLRNLLWSMAVALVALGLLVAGHRSFAAKRSGDTEVVILSTGAVQGYVEPCG